MTPIQPAGHGLAPVQNSYLLTTTESFSPATNNRTFATKGTGILQQASPCAVHRERHQTVRTFPGPHCVDSTCGRLVLHISLTAASGNP